MVAPLLRRTAFPALLLVALALGAGAAQAAARIATPDCATLGTWASAIDAKVTYDVAPKLSLPKALSDERLLPVFGLSALGWSRDDIGAANKTIKTCMAEAKKAGDAAQMQSLKTASWLLGKALPQTQGAIAKAAADIEKQTAAIAALPDSVELSKGIGALLAIDPAAPDAKTLAGLPRPVAGPLGGLVKDLAWTPGDAREALFATLAQRRSAILDGLADQVSRTIAEASPDADGVLAIMASRQALAAAGVSDQLDQMTPKAAPRADEIRASLRAVTPPAWVPPECLGLYLWSGAEGAGQVVTLGSQNTRAAFLDDALIPVFGVSVADWSDADLTRFATLRGLCQAEWTALLPGGQRIDNVGDEAPELLRLAKAGRWIDGADDQVANAKTVVATRHATVAALNAAREKIAALPDTVDSLGALDSLKNLPELRQANPDERDAYARLVTAKRAAIVEKSLGDAEDGLAAIEVAALGDFIKLYQYANASMAKLPDYDAQTRFAQQVDV